MIDQLIQTDRAWLLAINGWHAPWSDTLFWYISQSWVWIPLYIGMIVCLCRRYGWRVGLVCTLALCAAVGLADWISSGLIKEWVCRLRPTHQPDLQGMIHLVHGYTGGLYGFVSSHAANTMALALLYYLIIRTIPIRSAWHTKSHPLWWLLLYVVVNCYSRMYLGVHYPSDILGGLIVGAVAAWGVHALLHRILHRVPAWDAGHADVVHARSEVADNGEHQVSGGS